MISLANISSSNAATHYYEKDDYYAKDNFEHKSNSEWYGKGAQNLNLSGEVDKKDFKDVLEGKLSNNTELGRIQSGEVIHAPGIDLTFSAPKSVSIMSEVYGDSLIYLAQSQAVKKTLDYIEKELCATRKMVNGKLILMKTDNITAALFRHDVSRNLDPQLHTHCVLANIVKYNDEGWRSSYFKRIFDNKLFLGQIYRTELACELKQLGYEIRITGTNSIFELQNISESLIKTFSSRSKEIALAAEDYETINAKLKSELALKTRVHKQQVSKEQLLKVWQNAIEIHEVTVQKDTQTNNQLLDNLKDKSNQALNYINKKWEAFCEKFELAKVSAISSLSQDVNVNTADSKEATALTYAINHLSERQSVWEEKEMLKVAMGYAVGSVNLERLTIQIQKYKDEDKLLIAKSFIKNFETPVTTKAVLLKELETIDFMKKGQGTCRSICSTKVVDEHLLRSNLNSGQRSALKLILTSKDRIIGIQGYAGVGKTHMLNCAKELLNKVNYNIIGLAPTNSAAKVLENAAGIKSQTIHRFLFKYDGLIHERNTKTGLHQMKLSMDKTIVVLDEASLASTSQINALLKISNLLNFKVVQLGDVKQLNSVEAGKPFYQLQKNGMKTAIMKEIVRQSNVSLKHAVYNVIDGNIKDALTKLGKNIIEPIKKFDNINDTRDCLANLAANEWLNLNNVDRENTLITAPSHIIRQSINKEIRQQLKFEGTLKGKSMMLNTFVNKNLTKYQMISYQNYEVGDTILFKCKYTSIDINKNEYLTVIEISRDLIILQKQNGKSVGWQPHKVAGGRIGDIEVFQSKAIEIQAGDILRWTRNDIKTSDIINSNVFKILNIGDQNISYKTTSGIEKEIKTTDINLKHIDHAYALTVHAAQGKTYDRVIGVIESEHVHLTNQKLLYVTISRAKQEATLITDDKIKLQETLIRQEGEIISAQEHQTKREKTSIFVNSKPLDSTAKSYTSNTIKDVYYAIYDKLPNILPEFGFKKCNEYYVSTTRNKIDGSIGKLNKVYIYANNPGKLIDYTRGSRTIWDYISNNHMQGSNKNELMRYLRDFSGLTNSSKVYAKNIYNPIVQNFKLKSENSETSTIDKKVLRSIDIYAKEILFKTESNQVLNYLRFERKYSDNTIKEMGLGAILSKRDLGKYLKSEGYAENQIKEFYKVLHYIGDSHNLIIPYKDTMGEIIGFAARNINYQETDSLGKYLYTKGLSKSNTLLNINNLKDSKEVTIVEGLLDSLHAQAKGLNNVVALGGTSLNMKQLELLNQRNVNTVILCLDNDKAGKEAVERIKLTIINSKFSFEIKEINLPSGFKDPDQMIRGKGIEAFKQLVDNASLIKHNETIDKTLFYQVNSNKMNKANDMEM